MKFLPCRRSKSDNQPLSIDVITAPFALWFVVYLILSLIAGVILYQNDTVEKHAQKVIAVEQFNQLPRETRELLRSLSNGLTDWQSETATIKLNEDEHRYTEAQQKNFWRWWFAIAGLILSFAIFIAYYCEIAGKYYLIDFPKNTVLGWIVFLLCLPVGFPWLIGSYCNMRRDRWRLIWNELGPKMQSCMLETLLERKVHSVDPNDQLGTDAYFVWRREFHDDEPLRDTKMQEDNARKCAEQIRELEGSLDDMWADIARCKHRIADREQKMEETKRALSGLRAEHTEIRNRAPSAASPFRLTNEQAKEELQQIYALRGVQAVEILPAVTGQTQLVVTVRAYVNYESAVYDFGAWKIYLLPTSFRCVESFRTAFDSSSSIYYADIIHHYFCFGKERTKEIRAYLLCGDFLSALQIIVDSLHNVNEPEKIPEVYPVVGQLDELKDDLLVYAASNKH